jgi:AraC-like DNA-binding protein
VARHSPQNSAAFWSAPPAPPTPRARHGRCNLPRVDLVSTPTRRFAEDEEEPLVTTNADAFSCREFATNRPPERIFVHSACRITGVEFWTVTESTRRWSMRHDTFTAILLLGPTLEATWHSRGRARTAGAGSIQLMEPSEVHHTTELSGPASSFVVYWTPAALERAAVALGMGGTPRFRCPQVDDPALTLALLRLQSSFRTGGAADVEAAYLDSTRRLLELAAMPPTCPLPGPFHHPRVRRALEFIHESFAEPIPLALLASRAGLSKYYFARSFRAMTGLAPHQYQILLRLQAARRSLERGASVERAASDYGFSDAPHLTRMFGSWLGVTPAAWARGGQVSDGPPLLQVGPTSGDLCVSSATGARSKGSLRFQMATSDA